MKITHHKNRVAVIENAERKGCELFLKSLVRYTTFRYCRLKKIILYRKYSFTFVIVSSYAISEAYKGGNVHIIVARSYNVVVME
jgi:hypothetical protein